MKTCTNSPAEGRDIFASSDVLIVAAPMDSAPVAALPGRNTFSRHLCCNRCVALIVFAASTARCGCGSETVPNGSARHPKYQ